MPVYHHALVLINSSLDGVPLLQHAARMARNADADHHCPHQHRLSGVELRFR